MSFNHREARTDAARQEFPLFPLREFCLSFFPILVHVLPNSELEIFPAGPAIVSGEAAWVHPEPIALSTTDGTRRGTHVNVQPSHQARGRASPRGFNPGRDAGRWRAATHTSPHTRSAGQGEQCWQASLPAYTFLPRVPGRRGPRAAIRFQSPRLGSPYQPWSGAHHAQGVQNSSLNPGEPPRGGTPLTHSRAESPPREDRAGPGGVPRTGLRSPKFSSTYLGASSLFPPERSSPRPNNSPDIPRRQGRRLVHAAHHTHLEGGRRSGGRGSTVSRQGKTQPGLTRGTARG
jgi:hypothetical protein